jgi:hypothetical protein
MSSDAEDFSGPLNIDLPSSISQQTTDEMKKCIDLFKTEVFRCGMLKLNKSAIPFGKGAGYQQYYKTSSESPDIR